LGGLSVVLRQLPKPCIMEATFRVVYPGPPAMGLCGPEETSATEARLTSRALPGSVWDRRSPILATKSTANGRERQKVRLVPAPR
jgi:hypothetical protein